ncbi:MAG: tyrosine-type recombinase/integrase [Faecousia sp.]
MKQIKAKKLPSGKWHCRIMVNGEIVYITRDTEKEAVGEAMAIKAGILKAAKNPEHLTVLQAINSYIDSRRSVCSPATIRGYCIIRDNRFQSMMNKDIHSLTQAQWQRAVDLEAKRLSPKTLVNSWRFISSVICEATGERPSLRLPQAITKEKPWLDPEQIPIFVEAIRGSSIEIAALLALSSLRCSELLNLRWADIDLAKGVLKVNGAAVFDETGKLVHKKENKNKTSRRTVPIIPPLLAALQEKPHHGEYVVTMTANGIYKHINRVCREKGLPQVGIHGLRHSFASLAVHLKMPEKIAMQIGGWADDQTMRKIYTHISQHDIANQAAIFTGFFDKSQEKTSCTKTA